MKRVVHKVLMGKKLEKSVSKEKYATGSAVTPVEEFDPNKANEPYKCTGNFLADFSELCKQNQMSYIPPVVVRPKVPVHQLSVSEGKLDKKGDKKQSSTAPEPDLDGEVTDDKGQIEGPPKTYITADKYVYFKPRVQVELDTQDRWDTVTEVYIKGWKVDEPMMDILSQCWTKLSKLHTINLWNTNLTENTVHTLATFLQHCGTVRNLILDGNSVKEENWGELIAENSLIQNLSLRHCKITDKGVENIGKALGHSKRSNTRLASLNLSGNLIGDDGAERLAEGLRTNRSLLCLTLSNNNIGDRGAARIAEALSRFPLTHEEVVARRKLMSEKSSPTRKSPTPTRRSESRDRPGSVSRSTTSQDKTKQKLPAKKKEIKSKDVKEDTKNQKKEDFKSGSKGASNTSDVSKNVNKKDKKKEKGKLSMIDVDNAELQDINPLLEPAEYMEDQLWISGNRILINLNLSRNNIGEVGMAALLMAVQYQTTLTFENKSYGRGLMRLVVSKNAVSPDSETVSKLNELMLSKDPFYRASKTSIEHNTT